MLSVTHRLPSGIKGYRCRTPEGLVSSCCRQTARMNGANELMLPAIPRRLDAENELDLGPDFPFDYAGYIGPDSSGNDKPIGEIDSALHGTRIGIIGTGASGLIAGYQLMKIGLHPVYYEAEKNPDGTARIGGRMKALYGDPYEVAVAEMGCMRFPASAKTQAHYVQRFGLHYAKFPDPFEVPKTVVDLEGKTYSAASIEEFYQKYPMFSEVNDAWNAALATIDFKDFQQAVIDQDRSEIKSRWNTIVEKLDKTSFFDFLAQSGALSDEQIYIFGKVGFGTGGWDSFNSMSMLEILRLLVTGMETEQQLLVEGTSKFALGFWNDQPNADEMVYWPDGTSLASLNEPGPRKEVLAIQAEDDGDITIHTTDGDETFPAVIFTPQLHVLEASVVFPRDGSVFGDHLLRAIRGTDYWDSAKTFSFMEGTPWINEDKTWKIGMTISDRINRATYLFDYVDAYEKAGLSIRPGAKRESSICSSYSWGEDAQKVLPTPLGDRQALYSRALSETYPEESDLIQRMVASPGAVTVSWADEPNFRGLCKFNLPGKYAMQYHLFTHFMKSTEYTPNEPVNNGLFLCGDHISWSAGWVNHALQSGINAAAGVMHKLGGGGLPGNPTPVDKMSDPDYAPLPPD